jgi:hypothetical protein
MASVGCRVARTLALPLALNSQRRATRRAARGKGAGNPRRHRGPETGLLRPPVIEVRMRKLVVLPISAIALVVALMLAAVTALATAMPLPGEGLPSARAVADIPPPMLELYRRAAATCPGLPWTVSAAIGKVESDHGRSLLPGVQSGENFAGAGGPMQFLAGTWAAYGVDANGDGVANRYDPVDAVFGAARYLCASGAGSPAGLYRAIFAYNHSDAYVRRVLALAATYARPAASAGATTAALLANPRLTLSGPARNDLARGLVDQRLVATLAALLTRHTLTVSGFKTGHPVNVVTDSGLGAEISNHYYGRAADITVVDGAPVSRANLTARAVVLELKATPFPGRRPEIGQPWPDLVGDGVFTNAAHQRHLHLGFYSATTGDRGP